MLKFCFSFLFLTGLASTFFSQIQPFPVIPLPALATSDTGSFSITPSTLLVDSLNEFFDEIKAFNEQLNNYFGFVLPVASKSAGNSCILLFHRQEGNGNQSAEAYSMQVTKQNILITGYPAGVFHGLETLFQLMNGQIEISVPCVSITDKPTFGWRGMHLDVSRHFFTKEEIKKYLDYLALYKFNVFHWHLTDDQGWRIEIKKYPLLTQLGSERKETVIGKCSDTAHYDGKPYGGFYTQEDIKEIVRYATARHIVIVPEIEMPGHARAAMAAYPQFSCTGGPFEVATTWGGFDDVFCPKPETFQFLEDILTEVMQLFPGPYIHIGGDECRKKRWKSCPSCQALMKKEGLKNENELQSYFIRQIETFVHAHGKQMIGWDEILEGGLAPNAIVMSWRGATGGIKAAKQKHQVVMSPGTPCYFDHYQSKDRSTEPLAIGGFNPLENVYLYEPVPAKLLPAERKYILGAQGNVWTEYITTFSQVEYMSVPRMCALSEALWSPASKKAYAGFLERLKLHQRLLDRMKVNYATHFSTQK